MRKHPEVLALAVIALAVLVNAGLETAWRRLGQGRFTVHPLIIEDQRRVESLAEETVETVLREILHGLQSTR